MAIRSCLIRECIFTLFTQVKTFITQIQGYYRILGWTFWLTSVTKNLSNIRYCIQKQMCDKFFVTDVTINLEALTRINLKHVLGFVGCLCGKILLSFFTAQSCLDPFCFSYLGTVFGQIVSAFRQFLQHLLHKSNGIVETI